MKEPYEKTKEIDDTESGDELFSLGDESELEITSDDDESSKTVSPKSKKIKHHTDWRRRLDDYFDAKRIRELLDDEVESDTQDPLNRKSSLNRIIDDLHHDED